ncbi:MAG: hypothetical protein KBD37_00275 [Burkholderiales bacterium]|nr:hypothetical protein [Burkholderiales bacterium]
MSIKEKALDLVRVPETNQLSKFKIGLAVSIVVVIPAILFTIVMQSNKNQYFEEQQIKLQQKRSQASDIPMAVSGKGEDTRQFLEQQTKLKNQIVHDSVSANNQIGDPLPERGTNIPPIVNTNKIPVNTSPTSAKSQEISLQPQAQDAITQEYQNERLDKIKRKYASYKADTLLGPQPHNANASQPAHENISSDNNTVTQPTIATRDSQPSDGYVSPANSQPNSTPTNVDNVNNVTHNMQTEKNNFMLAKGKEMFSEDYINSSVKDPISKYEIKAGTPIPGFMITPINSDLPGVVTAQVARNIYDTKTGNYLLIPGGSRLIGVYDSNIAYGQSRVMVAWNRVIFPSGASYRLYGMPGTDAMGISGLTGEVNNHYGRIYGSAMVMGVITAGMQYSQNNSNSNVQTGTTYPNPTVGQSLAAGLGQQLGQAGLQVTQKNLNVQPTIEIPASQQINIMLTSDVVLRPIDKKAYMGNSINSYG